MRNTEFENNLRIRNREELERFSLPKENWGLKDYLALNSMITAMGLSAKPETMVEITKVAFGEKRPDYRTGNVGVGISYGPGFRSQAPVENVFKESGFNTSSILEIEGTQGNFYITTPFASFTVPIDIIPAPQWYSESVKIDDREYPFSQLAQSELGVIMLSIPDGRYQQCSYSGKGEKCKFCALEKKLKPLTSEIFASIVRKDLEEGRQTSVTMTGGNTYRPDNGFKKYKMYIDLLRAEFGLDLPIQVEASPPTDDDVKYLLARKVSLMANLEVWDDECRQKIMPAKSRVPKLRYLDVFKRMSDSGGDIYSVLIRDLEPRETYLEGVEELSKCGATTIVLPFKPNKESAYENRMPCSASELLESTIQANGIMRSYGLDLSRKSSYMCSGCGGCGVDTNEARFLGENYVK